MKKLTQALLLAACCATGAASATTMTVSSNSNIILSQDTDWDDFLTFAKFNSALGTLTSVKLDLYSTITSNVSLSNYNDDAATVPYGATASVLLNRPDNSNLLVINATLFNNSVSVAAGDTYYDSTVVQGHSSASYTNLSDLALFTGPGSITTLISAKATTSVAQDGIDTQFATQASGKGMVTYTYIAAVPEPESYGLMLTGLGMLGVVARRKRATRA